MGKCILFCAAEFDRLAQNIEDDDYVIAADGGLRHLKALSRKPDAILGDFDSLGFVPQGAEVFPVQKDDTDAMLAVRHGLTRGYREFVIYGGLDGQRLDHTVANYQTLQFLSDNGAAGYLIGKDYIVTVIKNETLRFPNTAEGVLSVFCLGEDARGVSIRGLQYPLQNGTLTGGFPLGVSNHFVGEAAQVTVENGSLLVMWDRKNGFPEGERSASGGTKAPPYNNLQQRV
ncbi:MAG: thiamine diphosphokinase [Oscillospiraceae bacterium]|nr:thiamine diphosphokinase [Oscillospiraceae bacterium]